MWRDMLDIAGIVGAGFLVIISFATTLSVSVDYLDCRGFERGTGIETKWEWGCYANVNGRWVPKKFAFGDAHEVRVK